MDVPGLKLSEWRPPGGGIARLCGLRGPDWGRFVLELRKLPSPLGSVACVPLTGQDPPWACPVRSSWGPRSYWQKHKSKISFRPLSLWPPASISFQCEPSHFHSGNFLSGLLQMKGRAGRNKVTFAELAGLFLNLLSRAQERVCVHVCVRVCARAFPGYSPWWGLELKLQTGLIL